MNQSERPYCFFVDGKNFAKAAQESLSQIQNSSVKEIGSTFAKNFDDLFEFAVFPLKLAMCGLGGQREMMNFMAACMRSKYPTAQSATEFGKDPLVTEAIQTEIAKIRKEDETQKWTDASAVALVTAVLQAENMQSTVRAMLFSLLISAWTLLEALSCDLWIILVNGYPVQLGAQIISNLSKQHLDVDSDEINNRGISLHLLAKHNFDLRENLGTILSRRFDFTCLSGIRRAYKLAFPNLDWNVFNNVELKQLQAYRHLIVHRAGIVDQSFIDTTMLNDAAVGDVVPLDGQKAEIMLGSAAECGGSLIVLIDSWVRQNPQN